MQTTLEDSLATDLSEKTGPLDVPLRATGWTRFEETARRLIILIALYAFPAILVMRPVDDLDIWWHLRTGQWIVENGKIPTTDPFSSFGQGKNWVAYSWLFEVAIYGLHRAMGLWGIVVFRVVMVFAIAGVIHRFVIKREPRFIAATALVGLYLLSIFEMMQERTWLFTVLFYTLTLDAVLNCRTGRPGRSIWLLPPLFMLWANLHIQFIHGLLLLAITCISPFIDRCFGSRCPGEHAARAGSLTWFQLLAVSLACLLATLVNPYHIRLYGAAWGLATQPAVKDIIGELIAMRFRALSNWALLALALGAAFALGRRRRTSSFDLLLLISAAYFSFQSQRDCFLMAITALALIITGDRPDSNLADDFVWTPRRMSSLALAIALVLACVGWWRGLTPLRLERAVAEKFPAEASAFVEKQGYGGPLYNSYDWGGYLLWRLPSLPVSMDGRAYVHGSERIVRSVDTWAAKPGWADDPELRSARLVIGIAKSPLMHALRGDPRFRLVHEDRLAVVFVAAPCADDSK